MSELAQLTIAKNIATNGRTFCVLLCAISLAVYLDRRDDYSRLLAVFSALPIGLGYLKEWVLIVNGLQPTFWSRTLGVLVVAIPIITTIRLILLV